ncbi:hypothetical protein EON67_01410 [archaeon]|nr:MAG: hypothetical protein EON67_01410 [archaeon]
MRRTLVGTALAAASVAALASVTLARQHTVAGVVVRPALQKSASALSCDLCQAVVGTLADMADNSTQLAELLNGLDSVCDSVFANNNSTRTACRDIASLGVDALPFLVSQMNTLAWDIPPAVCSVVFDACLMPCCTQAAVPEQLHLSLTGDMSQMAVTWVTLDATPTSTVQWFPTANASHVYSALGSNRTYTQGNWVGQIHTAVMIGLQPGTQYTYRVGDALRGWSAATTFNTLPANVGSTARPLRVIQVGDMGFSDASNNTIADLLAHVQAGTVDLIWHIGALCTLACALACAYFARHGVTCSRPVRGRSLCLQVTWATRTATCRTGTCSCASTCTSAPRTTSRHVTPRRVLRCTSRARLRACAHQLTLNNRCCPPRRFTCTLQDRAHQQPRAVHGGSWQPRAVV